MGLTPRRLGLGVTSHGFGIAGSLMGSTARQPELVVTSDGFWGTAANCHPMPPRSRCKIDCRLSGTASRGFECSHAKKTDLDLKRGGSRVDGLLGGSELDSLPTKFLKEGTLLATRPKSAENLGAFARSPRVALTHERARKWGTSVSAGGAHDKSH